MQSARPETPDRAQFEQCRAAIRTIRDTVHGIETDDGPLFGNPLKVSRASPAFQLSLLSRIYLSSGIVTSAGLLSVISSVFFIAKTGVQNFLQRHEEKLSEASTLGKICLAASVVQYVSGQVVDGL